MGIHAYCTQHMRLSYRGLSHHLHVSQVLRTAHSHRVYGVPEAASRSKMIAEAVAIAIQHSA
jgi:hypothetical protein